LYHVGTEISIGKEGSFYYGNKKFLKERIKENERLFKSEELEAIRKNKTVIRKIYQLGLMDATKTFLGGNV